MPVVSVRMEAEDLAFLRERSMGISEFVREAAHRRIELMRVKEAMERLSRVAVTPVEPVEKTIRDLRDAR